jgi:hypothetical protein
MGTDTTLFSTDLRLQIGKETCSILRDVLNRKSVKIESLDMYVYLRLGGGSVDDGEGWSRLLWPPPGESASAAGSESARGESVPVLQYPSSADIDP